MVYLIVILGCFAAIAAAGFLYQWIGAWRDRRRFASSGRWIAGGQGRGHFLVEKGSGGPAVVFESGIAATHLNWSHIQTAISEHTRTVSYDRAGLGWSSPSKTPRTPGNIAVELRQMLKAAGIKPPFLLVGHSFGGLVVRRFATLFPEEVAGVVLVDPMRCEEWPPLDPTKQASVDRGVRLSGYAVPIARLGLARMAVTSLLCRSGRLCAFLARAAGDSGKQVLARIQDEVGKMPREVRPMVAAYWSRPDCYVEMARHIAAVPDSVREMLASAPISGIPITLLTPGRSTALSEERAAEIGDRVRQVIASGSAHWIHLDEPELVVVAILEMTKAVATPLQADF